MCLCWPSSDPWSHEGFRKHYGWLLELDADIFRSKALKSGLITDEEGEVVAALEKKGTLAHNAKLLSLVKGGCERTFHLLVETVTLLGEKYSDKRQELKLLLPCTGKSLCSCLQVYANYETSEDHLCLVFLLLLNIF